MGFTLVGALGASDSLAAALALSGQKQTKAWRERQSDGWEKSFLE